MAEVSQSVLSRISKLLAMADTSRGATENEAAIAAQKAQELLQEYGLSIAEIEASGGKSSDEGAAREKKIVQRGAMYKWQKELMEKIAEANFCMHHIKKEFVDGRWKNRHQLIGRTVNVQATVMVYDYLLSTMKRLVREAGHAPGTHSEKDYHYWLEGCATRLGERIQTAAYEAREESARKEREKKAAASHPSAPPASGTALVLADVYLNEDELNKDMLEGLEPGTHTRLRLENEARRRAREEKEANLLAQGIDPALVWYMMWYNCTEERARELVEAEAKRKAEEDARPKKAVRIRPRKERQRRWTNADEKEWQKRNSASYQAGSRAGEEIGLDPQVKHEKKERIGRG